MLLTAFGSPGLDEGKAVNFRQDLFDFFQPDKTFQLSESIGLGNELAGTAAVDEEEPGESE
jgi:hypothetical protein